MKKLISILTILSLALGIAAFVPPARAAAITSPSDTLSNSVVSALSNHTIVFTSPTGVAAGQTIILTFPAGFNMGAVAFGDVDVQDDGVDVTLAAAPNLGTYGLVKAGQAITLTSGNGVIAAGSVITFKIGTNAAFGGAGVNQITNPAVANNYNIAVTGTFTDTGNIPVTANPAAIADLSCQGANDAGVAYLLWTVPAGVTGGYTIRYSTGDINTQNLFNAATDYANTFASGTPGQSSGSQMLIGLAPNANYFFNVEAKGAGTSVAAISNAGVTCRVGGGSSSSTPAVPSAPLSTISAPTDNSSVPAEKDVVIRGSSSDSVVSSINKVEVSTDGGVTWAVATPTVSNANYGFDWTYLWTLPAEGPHVLKSRATDRAGVVETPGTGITVTVAPKPGIIYLPGQTPAPGSPASPASPSGVTLYRVDGDPRVYVIKDGKKEWIKTETEFNAAGYSWGNVQTVNQSQLDSYPEIGAVIVKIVNASALRVRQSNTTKSNILGSVKRNETYSVIEENNGWYKIKTKSGTIGWILGLYAEKQ